MLRGLECRTTSDQLKVRTVRCSGFCSLDSILCSVERAASCQVLVRLTSTCYLYCNSDANDNNIRVLRYDTTLSGSFTVLEVAGSRVRRVSRIPDPSMTTSSLPGRVAEALTDICFMITSVLQNTTHERGTMTVNCCIIRSPHAVVPGIWITE